MLETGPAKSNDNDSQEESGEKNDKRNLPEKPHLIPWNFLCRAFIDAATLLLDHQSHKSMLKAVLIVFLCRWS